MKNRFEEDPLIWKNFWSNKKLVFTALAYLISILRYSDLFDI